MVQFTVPERSSYLFFCTPKSIAVQVYKLGTIGNKMLVDLIQILGQYM